MSYSCRVRRTACLAALAAAFAGATGKAWGLEKAEAFRYMELA